MRPTRMSTRMNSSQREVGAHGRRSVPKRSERRGVFSAPLAATASALGIARRALGQHRDVEARARRRVGAGHEQDALAVGRVPADPGLEDDLVAGLLVDVHAPVAAPQEARVAGAHLLDQRADSSVSAALTSPLYGARRSGRTANDCGGPARDCRRSVSPSRGATLAARRCRRGCRSPARGRRPRPALGCRARRPATRARARRARPTPPDAPDRPHRDAQPRPEQLGQRRAELLAHDGHAGQGSCGRQAAAPGR